MKNFIVAFFATRTACYELGIGFRTNTTNVFVLSFYRTSDIID